MLIHADRLTDPDSPHAPEQLWEWEGPYVHAGLDHGVGHLVSMTTEQTHDSIQIGIEIR